MQALCRSSQSPSCARFAQQKSCSLLRPSVQRPRLCPGSHCRARQASVAALQRGEASTAETADQENKTAVIQLLASLGIGLGLGVAGPVDHSIPDVLAQHASACLGWSYFAAWTLSFYPQVMDNRRRQSVVGLSGDFVVYSCLGFAAYAFYTANLYFNPDIQQAYALVHHGTASDVQLADVLFAGHALAISLFTLWQFATYERGTGEALSPSCKGLTAALLLASAAFIGHMQLTCDANDCGAGLSLLYFFGGVKCIVTAVKYVPQALLNFERRSTEGWPIGAVLLDLSGGVLSLSQILLDAVARDDWSVVTGNPAKLGIAGISLAFDLLFIAQHYFMFKGDSEEDDGEALLPEPVKARAPLGRALPWVR